MRSSPDAENGRDNRVALGMRHALGAPATMAIASHIGFGAIAQARGVSRRAAVFTTIALSPAAPDCSYSSASGATCRSAL
jgi:hypothetical protein